jgi:hypothetical protein
MSLVPKQQRFAVAIAKLILYADSIGLPVTFGDAYRDKRLHGAMGVKQGYGEANSCHKLRLAVDLNIIKDGKLAPESEYLKLQAYWRENLGGSKTIPGDANHFSWQEGRFR